MAESRSFYEPPESLTRLSLHDSVIQFDIHYFVKSPDRKYYTTIKGTPLRFYGGEAQGFTTDGVQPRLKGVPFLKNVPLLRDLPVDLRDAIWNLAAKCGPPDYRVMGENNGAKIVVFVVAVNDTDVKHAPDTMGLVSELEKSLRMLENILSSADSGEGSPSVVAKAKSENIATFDKLYQAFSSRQDSSILN